MRRDAERIDDGDDVSIGRKRDGGKNSIETNSKAESGGQRVEKRRHSRDGTSKTREATRDEGKGEEPSMLRRTRSDRVDRARERRSREEEPRLGSVRSSKDRIQGWGKELANYGATLVDGALGTREGEAKGRESERNQIDVEREVGDDDDDDGKRWRERKESERGETEGRNSDVGVVKGAKGGKSERESMASERAASDESEMSVAKRTSKGEKMGDGSVGMEGIRKGRADEMGEGDPREKRTGRNGKGNMRSPGDDAEAAPHSHAMASPRTSLG